jgi:hypothetical protein
MQLIIEQCFNIDIQNGALSVLEQHAIFSFLPFRSDTKNN